MTLKYLVVISTPFDQPKISADEVSLRVVRDVRRDGNSADIDMGEGAKYHFTGEKTCQMLSQLKSGDKVFLIRNGREVKMVYGPVNEQNLFLIAPYCL